MKSSPPRSRAHWALTLVARDGALTNISMHEQCHVSPPRTTPFRTTRGSRTSLRNSTRTSRATVNVRSRDESARHAIPAKCVGQLCEIPYGETISYGELASGSGTPRRRVPLVWLTVVIHLNHRAVSRVIGPTVLTGYGGGLERKTWLLELESKRRS